MRLGKLKIKAQLYCGDELAMGPGKADLLEAIDREGSISAAGRAMGMSYRRSWLLVDGMNRLTGEPLLDAVEVERQARERDAELANPFTKDVQVMSIHNGRRSLGDRLLRVAAPHRILDPGHGPLVAVMLHVLTRKTLGGIQTDLESRALGPDARPVPGLYAAGEAAGFGGGGAHGYNALEGTFLGGCLLTGRTAGRASAAAL